MKFFKNIYFYLFLFAVLGTIFRFYNLNWGKPYYFNPDERSNVAYPIAGSNSPFMLDQNNFDIGTFPLIIIKNTLTALSFIAPGINPKDIGTIIFVGRMYSGLFSLGILVLLFYTGRLLKNKTAGILATVLGICSVGFVEFSHFTTIEVWEAFFFLLLFYLNCRLLLKGKLWESITFGIIFGLALATKLLSAFLVFPITIGILMFLLNKQVHLSFLGRIKKTILFFVLIFPISFGVFFLFSPQIFLHFNAFYNSIHFESQVATGTLPIFFTQSFLKTTPVVFQLLKIYPFLLNPLVTIVFLLSFLYLSFIAIKKLKLLYILLLLYFLLLFLSQSFLFVKWTRYMVPTLPFVYLITAVGLTYWIEKVIKISKVLTYTSVGGLVLFSYVFCTAFFLTVYTHPDTRFAAADYASKVIPRNARIISEAYDPGDGPVKDKFPQLDYINPYYLETDTNIQKETQEKIATSKYYVLVSPRLLRSRILNPADFPKGHTLYTQLLNGTLGYTLIYETPCDLLCNLVYLGDPVFSLEETATVFDRPSVFIFEKQSK